MILLVIAMILSLHVERSALRPVAARDQAERGGGGGGRHLTRWRQKMYAIMLSGGIAAAAAGCTPNVLLVVTPQTMSACWSRRRR